MRWNKFVSAKQFIHRRDEQAESHDINLYAQIEITHYESISEVQVNIPDQNNPDVVSVYDVSYFNKNDYSIKHMQYEHVWWFDEEAEIWFLDSDLPDFNF